jgi:hypothetical protein
MQRHAREVHSPRGRCIRRRQGGCRGTGSAARASGRRTNIRAAEPDADEGVASAVYSRVSACPPSQMASRERVRPTNRRTHHGSVSRRVGPATASIGGPVSRETSSGQSSGLPPSSATRLDTTVSAVTEVGIPKSARLSDEGMAPAPRPSRAVSRWCLTGLTKEAAWFGCRLRTTRRGAAWTPHSPAAWPCDRYRHRPHGRRHALTGR